MPGGKNQTPKKSHAHAKFPSLENFQKKLNDITQQNLQIVLTKKKTNVNQSSHPRKSLHKMHKYLGKMIQQSYEEHIKQISSACIDH